jgi:outer membrane protein OmpA-like peptidoglycan-associated protein
MNSIRNVIRNTLYGSASAAALLLAGCAADVIRDPATAQARAELTTLQSDPNLASRAPLATKDAEAAVQQAEAPQTDAVEAAHLGYIAERRVQIAQAKAQTAFADEQHKQLVAQTGQIQLDARTHEADAANRKSGELQVQADAAKQKADDLQAQLLALQAKQTDRGMVLTLGDVLFTTGRSDLKAGSVANLDRLVTFLGQAPDRSVRIEGHTDNRGGQELNQVLSQRRAESVANYLTGRGVAVARVTSVGEGYNAPVADNNTEAGRQANRRVEVIIQNAPQ